jgi:two-component system, chemotaxis family, sensor kinase CheA
MVPPLQSDRITKTPQTVRTGRGMAVPDRHWAKASIESRPGPILQATRLAFDSSISVKPAGHSGEPSALSLQTTITAVAEAVARTDRSDLPGLVALQDLLLELAAQAAAERIDSISNVSRQAAELCLDLVVREVADASEALGYIGAAVLYAQRVFDASERGEPATAFRSPFENAPLPGGAAHALGKAAPPINPSIGCRNDEPIELDGRVDEAALESFRLDARQHLAGIEVACLRLECNPHEVEAVDSAFRAVHTIKGLAACLGRAFEPIVELTHAVETLLDSTRYGDGILLPEELELILASCDALSHILCQGEGQPQTRTAPSRGFVHSLITRLHTASERAISHQSDRSRTVRLRERTVPAEADRGPRSMKVPSASVQRLFDRLGEAASLVQILCGNPTISTIEDPQATAMLKRLTAIVAESHGLAKGLRHVSIESTLQPMARVVRDLAISLGKRISLCIVGGSIEIDRDIADAIAEPLLHLIRNSCDHGIEAEAERIARGKEPVGTISITAVRHGRFITIDVTDDGCGLQRERIIKRCIENKLLPSGTDPFRVTDEEIRSFVFLPGFSTAERVSAISGRGVGLDVVKHVLEDLGGRLEVRSTPGAGTTFSMSVPIDSALDAGPRSRRIDSAADASHSAQQRSSRGA